MRRQRAGIAVIVFILLLIDLCVGAASTYCQDRKHFLWRVQSSTTTVYLLGSIHLLKKDVYPLDGVIENAFEKSAVLAVEANINDINRINVQQLVASAFYPEGETLKSHVSKSTYDLVRNEAEQLGMLPELVDRQKPWFLALMMESLELMRSGYDPQFGIDGYFLSRTREKKIVELESVDYQINLLSSFSDEEQELFLQYTLKDLRALERQTNDLVAAWKSGDVRSMELIVTESLRGDGRFSLFYEKLLYGRNRNMASRVEGFLRAGGSYFVVVGAAHLIGERGIVQILKGKGYSVEQL